MRYHSLKHYRKCLRMLLGKLGEDRAWQELNKYLGVRGKVFFFLNRSNSTFLFLRVKTF